MEVKQKETLSADESQGDKSQGEERRNFHGGQRETYYTEDSQGDERCFYLGKAQTGFKYIVRFYVKVSYSKFGNISL